MEICLSCGRPTTNTRSDLIQMVLKEIADLHGVSLELMKGDARNGNLVKARQHAYYELHLLGFSSSHVGRIMRRDHSTVLHGIRVHKDRMRRMDEAEERKRNSTPPTRRAEGGTRKAINSEVVAEMQGEGQ